MKIRESFVFLSLLIGANSRAEGFDSYNSNQLQPEDYYFGHSGNDEDEIFEKYRSVDLNLELGWSGGCGQIDFVKSLRSNLKEIMDFKYFGEMGLKIISSPMLYACYLSPTACAIAKHQRIEANFLAQMRQSQCSIIDKYVDSRVEEYDQERQSCLRAELKNNGGDAGAATEKCGTNYWKGDMANWAGKKYGEKVPVNHLIDSSARWAGFTNSESEGTINLVKALVGDMTIQKGRVSVGYGKSKTVLTPRTYLLSLQRDSYKNLCDELLGKINEAGLGESIDEVIDQKDLEKLQGPIKRPVVDVQTLDALRMMPYRERKLACKKLANAVAMTQFSHNMSQSVDVLNTLSQNPNLPENRRRLIEDKRRALKDAVDLTVSLQKNQNEPLNEVVAQINSLGNRRRQGYVREKLESGETIRANRQVHTEFFDCADGVLCGDGGM